MQRVLDVMLAEICPLVRAPAILACVRMLDKAWVVSVGGLLCHDSQNGLASTVGGPFKSLLGMQWGGA
jgi:hypothetical protein